MQITATQILDQVHVEFPDGRVVARAWVERNNAGFGDDLGFEAGEEPSRENVAAAISGEFLASFDDSEDRGHEAYGSFDVYRDKRGDLVIVAETPDGLWAQFVLIDRGDRDGLVSVTIGGESASSDVAIPPRPEAEPEDARRELAERLLSLGRFRRRDVAEQAHRDWWGLNEFMIGWEQRAYSQAARRSLRHSMTTAWRASNPGWSPRMAIASVSVGGQLDQAATVLTKSDRSFVRMHELNDEAVLAELLADNREAAISRHLHRLILWSVRQDLLAEPDALYGIIGVATITEMDLTGVPRTIDASEVTDREWKRAASELRRLYAGEDTVAHIARELRL